MIKPTSQSVQLTDGPRQAIQSDLHIGGRLKSLRQLRGLSQEALGEAVGITFQQVQKYENGKNRISAGRLFAFAQYLEVPVQYFFEGMEGTTNFGSPLDYDQQILDVLRSRDGARLVRAFSGLSDPLHRRAVVQLAVSLANCSDEAD
jgi:transcriptional regulator with XRE-family HTH domain